VTLRFRLLSPFRLAAVSTLLVNGVAFSFPAIAQVHTSALPAVRVTGKVNNAVTQMLPNTHPAVVSRAVIGARVAASTSLSHLRLVLSSSDAQTAALTELMAEQQDRTSANYHKWLTPDTFGQYFGVAPSDIASVSAWLVDQGFTIESVAKGGRIISFAGSVGQVETSFHTQMNHITVDGESHIANTTDIAVPAALGGVVRGIASLNDFHPRANSVGMHRVEFGKGTAVAAPVKIDGVPDYTSASTGSHYVAPGDAAIIFNSTPLLNAGVDGTGVTVAVLGRSNITVSDVQQFRSMFGLKKNDPTIINTGEDSGVNTDDLEAYLDVEWAGGMAPGATVNFIDGGTDYETTSGIANAGLYAVDNNIGDIITLSYGGCETNDGASGTAFWNTLWQQAASQGQSVFVSSGDSSATGCSSSSATYGTAYGVNALGSSAYNVAVGGTMFVDYGPSTYWAAPNTSTPFTTALSYIPEAVWNQGSLSTTYLNSLSTAPVTGTGIAGGGGGISIYTARPAWQTGSGISATADPTPPQGTGIAANSPITGPHRLVPDISLIAASGHDATVFCGEGVCYDNSNGYGIGAIGGTSVATPVMASIQALIDEKNGGRQGNPNFFYYPLANADFAAGNCQAVNGTAANPAVTLPASTCNFHDVVAGSNRVQSSASDTTGLGFNAGSGFDPASGLGSVNIANVANNWSSVALQATTTTFTLTPTAGLTHGASQIFAATVAASSGSGTPTGDISVIAETTLPGVQLRFTLTNGAYNGSLSGLPGGNYKVHVHYGGDGNFAASDSASVPVSIGKESSSIAVTLADFYPGFVQTGSSSIPYGYLVDLIGTVSGPSTTGTPSGSMTFSVAQNGMALAGVTNTVDASGSAALVAGASYTSLYLAPNYPTLNPGTYVVTLAYSGDASFGASTASSAFTVAKVTPAGTYSESSTYINSGQSVTLNYTVARITSSTFPTLAAYPTGTVTFTDTTSGTVLGTASLNAAGIASLATTGITVSGANSISAAYAGDNNYAGVTSTGTVTVGTLTSTTTMLTAANAAGGTDYVESTAVLTATVNPAVAGTVSFYDGSVRLGTATSSATTGIAALSTTALTAGTHTLSAVFGGTATYATSSGGTSLAVSQNVTVLIVEAPTMSTYGQSIAFSGRINRTPTVATPVVGLTGTVTFYDGGKLIGSATPVYTTGYAYYTATFALTTITAGTHTLTAFYSGDSNYTSANSAYVTTVVAKLSPPLTLTSPSSVYATNGSTTLTATLPLSSALAAPTAGISFYNGSNLLGTVTPMYSAAAGGYVATFTVSGFTAGPNTFTATYPGDSNYNSVSAALALTVTANNVWIANGNGTVTGITQAGAAITPSTGAPGGGIGIAIDNSGNIWSLNQSANSVSKFTNTGASISTGYTGAGINAPNALTIDGNGLVWIANSTGTLSVLKPSGAAVAAAAYAIGASSPTSINVDGSGNLWLTNVGDNSVTEVIGAAAPVTTPTTTAVQSNSVAAKP
jgi:hypothetical protein